MAIMRTGRAPVGGSMVGKRAAPAPVRGSMVGARRFAEGGDTKKGEGKKKPVHPEEGDLNPFGKDTPKILKEIKEGRRMAKGGKTAHYAKGGMVGKASKRADGCAVKGKTKGKMR
jgi:hypothetical protein